MAIFGGFFFVAIQHVQKKLSGCCSDHKFIDYFLLPYELLIGAGDEYDTFISFRICSLAFRLFGIFIALSYSSDITAYLSSKPTNLPFESIEELVENTEYKLLVEPGYIIDFYFQNRNDTIGEKIKSERLEYYYNDTDFFSKLCGNGYFAVPFISSATFYFSHKCEIYRIFRPVEYVFEGSWLNPDNHYGPLINHKYLQAWESGLAQNIVKKQEEIWDFGYEVVKRVERLGLSHLTRLFWFLVISFIMGLMFLLCEFIQYRIKKIAHKETNEQGNKEILELESES